MFEQYFYNNIFSILEIYYLIHFDINLLDFHDTSIFIYHT